jgi:tetratricopeptide (TPR) repeat protein
VPPPAPSSAAAAAAAASTAPQPGLDKRAENKDARPANASSPAPKPRPSSAASAASAAAAAAGEDKPTTANADDRQAERNALYYSESALGSLAFKQGSYAAAEEHFGRALELIPPADQSGRMILLNNRAAVREKLADFKGVVDDTTSALLIDKACVGTKRGFR